MKTIWKYEIDSDSQVINMPVGSEILTVQTQLEKPCLWALVEDEHTDKEGRHIKTFGTGWPVNNGNLDYIGTYQLSGGHLIFHVFEDK